MNINLSHATLYPPQAYHPSMQENIPSGRQLVSNNYYKISNAPNNEPYILNPGDNAYVKVDEKIINFNDLMKDIKNINERLQLLEKQMKILGRY